MVNCPRSLNCSEESWGKRSPNSRSLDVQVFYSLDSQRIQKLYLSIAQGTIRLTSSLSILLTSRVSIPPPFFSWPPSGSSSSGCVSEEGWCSWWGCLIGDGSEITSVSLKQ